MVATDPGIATTTQDQQMQEPGKAGGAPPLARVNVQPSRHDKGRGLCVCVCVKEARQKLTVLEVDSVRWVLGSAVQVAVQRGAVFSALASPIYHESEENRSYVRRYMTCVCFSSTASWVTLAPVDTVAVSTLLLCCCCDF